MARKSSPLLTPEPSPLDDPFDGRGLPERPPEPPPAPRSGPTCGQVIGGLLEIVIIAAIAFLSCGLISGALVWAGEDRGLLAEAPPTAAPNLLAGLPTVAPLNVPTLPAVAPTAPPTSAPEERAAIPATAAPQTAQCADGAAWWFAQQDAFSTFGAALPGLIFASENPAALRARLTPRRDALQAAGPPNCLEAPYAALLRAMDAVLVGLDAATAENTAAVNTQSEATTAALAETVTSLWDVGVFTAPEAATTRGIARGSGECAGAWQASLTTQWVAFRTAAAAADPRTAPALTMNLRIGEMNTILDATMAIEAPVCATDVFRYTIEWMTGTTDALRAWVAQDSAGAGAAAAEAGRAAVLLQAWLDWLGVEAL